MEILQPSMAPNRTVSVASFWTCRCAPEWITILDDEFGFEPGTITRLADGSVPMIVQVSQFSGAWSEVSSDLQTWTAETSVDQNNNSPFETGGPPGWPMLQNVWICAEASPLKMEGQRSAA